MLNAPYGMLAAGGVLGRRVRDGVAMTANRPSPIAESARSAIHPDAQARHTANGELATVIKRFRAKRMQRSLAARSFRELWARADVGYRADVVHMRHPLVGDLYLHPNRFNIPHSGGQHMLTYRADPDSDSAKGLDALRSLS